MTACTDNARLGLVGCGATYGGELQHSVARVDWSEHLDGRAHLTGTTGQIDALWRNGRLHHPDELPKTGLRIVDGRLRYPASEWQESRDAVRQSDETGASGGEIADNPGLAL